MEVAQDISWVIWCPYRSRENESPRGDPGSAFGVPGKSRQAAVECGTIPLLGSFNNQSLTGDVLQLFLYTNSPLLQVYLIPGKCQDFSFAQSERNGTHV